MGEVNGWHGIESGVENVKLEEFASEVKNVIIAKSENNCKEFVVTNSDEQ